MIIGNKHRYHIESAVASGDIGDIYRAFVRRRVGGAVKRRYYAVIKQCNQVPTPEFDSALTSSIKAIPYNVFEEERFVFEGNNYVVVAKGTSPHKNHPRLQSLQNHGYLMLILAALILILMIVKFFQSPTDNQVLEIDNASGLELIDAE